MNWNQFKTNIKDDLIALLDIENLLRNGWRWSGGIDGDYEWEGFGNWPISHLYENLFTKSQKWSNFIIRSCGTKNKNN